MLLAIDIGNTNTVFGVFNGLDLLVNWRTETAADRQLDEWGIQIISIMKYFKLCPDQITGIIISSVVPTLMWNFNRMANRYFKIDPMIVSPEIKTDIKIMLDNPQEVGADRIVNATAAYNRYKNAVIVVDFGTATTFDSISHRGEYCGGVITPGFNISMDALFGNASKLPRVELKKPEVVVGRNTIESIQSGLINGYVCMVDGIVKKMWQERGGKCHVLATGGLALMLITESETIEDEDEFLTLRGLSLLYQRN